MARRPLDQRVIWSYAILVVSATILLIGVVMVVTTTPAHNAIYGGQLVAFFVKYTALLMVGLAAASYVGVRFSTTKLLPYSILLYGVVLVTLAWALVGGTSVNGASRWISLGFLSFQPSELAKFAACVAVPVFLRYLHQRYPMSNPYVLTLLGATPAIGLVFAEPDFGTGGIITFIVLASLFVDGMPRHTATRIATGVGVLAVSVVVLAPHVPRLHYLLGRFHATDQARLSEIALGSGGVTGFGLGHSRMMYGFLSAAHTDFIFAIIGETFGLIGSIAVVLLFAALVVSGIQAALHATDDISRTIAFGITAWLGLEAGMNIMMVSGIGPIIGVPLPLVSDGGTALVLDLVAVGVLYNIARYGTLNRARPPRLVKRTKRTA